MKKILVPCDFSASAIEGLHFAVELAAATSAAITVLSVISLQQQMDEFLVSEGFRENFENEVIKLRLPIPICHKIRLGKFAVSVIDAIAEERIDLVVIGTRGSRGWEGPFMGSNVEKIIKVSPVPVFAVKAKTHLAGIRNVVFPCDLMLSEHYGMTRLKKIQAELGATLHLLRIDTSGFLSRETLYDRIKEYAIFHGLSKYTINIVTDTDETAAILHFAKQLGADMIAMTTRGAADLNHLYMSSIAADVVNHAHLLTWTCIQQPVKQPV
ncbi:universal stress protein [Dyadobacter luticola]|uniref:UspA domain-containing protein n=1 Tax=Dyadobacter luticola TaxID=1979387 RepID=A0A5R9L267_9BACT|nr:universal stress protein [Dyadobacter luticola]TLV02439.1 hypothetical protein FEN17_02045 [Dyadobacter luticola]